MVVFQHLLLSFKLIRAEPSLCFSPDQISDPGIHYMFFPAGAPPADLIALHKSTVMHIKHSGLKALPSGSGFGFRDVRPFEGNFSAHTLWRVIFLPSQFSFQPTWCRTRPVTGPNVLAGSICKLLSECSGWQCGLQERDSGQRLCGF